jgi:Holliday junction resolvase
VSNYSAGTRIEYLVRDDLQAKGYHVMRSRGSKGAADLVAVGQGCVLFIQCKRGNPQIKPYERAALVRLADRLPVIGVPVVACKPLRQGITYRALTGYGPKDWLPFEPTVFDMVEAVALDA